ncbi:hypothetical protein MC7420_6804 [Coleofasciculus chthonoplastes PCC 7420]|uniref:FdxN element excision controlling factor protein n=1 Tax=Coleofasciculus chthonoplastes PCC 7420 TaxID=118168 RepID=B4VWN2_9CYAN|nr:hypothetical protein MC7420_6804 [Coleofasciculus chthonoplastes PCC 7420]
MLYLAIRQMTYQGIFNEPLGELIRQKYRVNLLIFNNQKQEIVQWLP